MSGYLTRRFRSSLLNFSEDEVTQVARVRDSLDDEMLGHARRFHLDVAEIDDGSEEAVDVRRHVLHAVKEKARDLPTEEAELVDVYNAPVREEPCVEEVRRERVERTEPEKQPPDAEGKSDPGVRERRFFLEKCLRFGRKEGEKERDEKRYRGEYGERQELKKEDEPVLPHLGYHVFPGFFSKFAHGLWREPGESKADEAQGNDDVDSKEEKRSRRMKAVADPVVDDDEGEEGPEDGDAREYPRRE